MDLKQPRVACDFVIQVVSSHDPWSLPGTLAPASISNNNDTSISISATISAVPRNTLLTPLLFTHFNEQGPHARLNQIHVDLRSLRRKCDHALRGFKTKHESGVQRWTSESQRCVLCHVSPLILRLRLHSRQADRALIVVKHVFAARVYKFSTDPRIQCRTLTKLS